MSKKLGRPFKTAYPKTEKFAMRISEPEMALLNRCAEVMGVSRSDVVVRGIELLADMLSKEVM